MKLILKSGKPKNFEKLNMTVKKMLMHIPTVTGDRFLEASLFSVVNK